MSSSQGLSYFSEGEGSTTNQIYSVAETPLQQSQSQEQTAMMLQEHAQVDETLGRLWDLNGQRLVMFGTIFRYFSGTQETITGWWFGTFFIFPYPLGIIIPIDYSNIFQMG